MSHDLPPGFRFHPTDEELILYYLSNQAAARPCPVPIIPELNIYNYDPWELPGKSDMADGEGEWYFFSPRHRKYPNGARPNRATASGYWKATGTDKAIHSGSRYVGVKKALVFYLGRPPRGSKTEWIMHEYRLDSTKPNGSSRVLDEWVLCRIYKKKQQKSSTDDRPQDVASLPRAFSLAHLLDSDYISPSQLFEDNPLGSVDDLFDGSSGGGDAAVAVAGIQGGLLNPLSIFEH